MSPPGRWKGDHRRAQQGDRPASPPGAALAGLVPALLVLALLAPAAAHACGDALPAAERRLATGPAGWQLAFAPRPAPLVTGRHFALDIVLCAPPGRAVPATLAVDADMPAHRHGMNYRATVQSLGDGRFEAQGLMLHMPGRWRLLFDLPAAADQPAVRLSHEADLR